MHRALLEIFLVFIGDGSNTVIIFVCVVFGSHGQLGHGVIMPEEEPRVVEALWGMPMTCVATGGWHSACISGICFLHDVVFIPSTRGVKHSYGLFFTDGGDLYVWGWNESGQLGLPSRGLRKAKQQLTSQQAGSSALLFLFT